MQAFKEESVIIQDQKDLDGILKYWIDFLGVNDWQISSQLVEDPSNEMQSSDTAEVILNDYNKVAIIVVSSWNAFSSIYNHNWNMEASVIKALLMLKYYSVERLLTEEESLVLSQWDATLREMSLAIYNSKNSNLINF